MHHRLIHLLFLAVFLVPNGWAQGDIPNVDLLPFARNLQTDGEVANKAHLPIMIMFVSDDCPYCSSAKEDFIKPMLKSGEYNDKVIIRLVEIDGGDTITDFHGNQTTMADFATSEKVNFMPYVKFYNAAGKELVQPIVGISNKDYYGMFLDDAIEDAGKQLRQ